MRLFAEVSDEGLLSKLMHELGSTFYRVVSDEGCYEVVYFSANKIVRFVGKLSEQMAKLIKANGYEVASIEIDETTDRVRIVQSR